MVEQRITALMIEPGEHPKVTSLLATNQGFRDTVSFGCDDPGVARVEKLEPGVYVLYCDEGFPLELEGNRHIGDTIFAGTIYIIAADKKGNPVSLSGDILQKYMVMLWEPEEISYHDLAQAYADKLSKDLDEIAFS